MTTTTIYALQTWDTHRHVGRAADVRHVDNGVLHGIDVGVVRQLEVDRRRVAVVHDADARVVQRHVDTLDDELDDVEDGIEVDAAVLDAA